MDQQTGCADSYIVFMLLDLHELTGHTEYLKLAVRIGDNLLKNRFHNGFFTASADHLFARVDDLAPLALLHLHAALTERKAELPFYPGGNPFFHCDYEGRGRTYDGEVIYGQRRN
jgi:pectate lyase